MTAPSSSHTAAPRPSCPDKLSWCTKHNTNPPDSEDSEPVEIHESAVTIGGKLTIELSQVGDEEPGIWVSGEQDLPLTRTETVEAIDILTEMLAVSGRPTDDKTELTTEEEATFAAIADRESLTAEEAYRQGADDMLDAIALINGDEGCMLSAFELGQRFERCNTKRFGHA